MTMRALTLPEVAAGLGRSAEWLSAHWRRLVAEKKLPPPLIERGGPTWDAAQLYAMLDKHLPAAVRANAAAIRAAFDAAHASPRDALHTDELAEWRARLDKRFGEHGAVGTGQPKRPAEKERA
ncbi:MAG TPA: hypothetical protein PK857_00410 [Hyphomicrobium sp.]|nr:hypothetical protein [Hyphomicrobium sp.]HRO48798.1 hypothetical protein [Hyphomicrobium sp.]